MPTINLPPLYTPFSNSINPRVAQVTQGGLDWMASMGLCGTPELAQMVADSRAGEFCSRVSPHAPLPQLQLAVDTTYMGFLLDELHHDGDYEPVRVAPSVAFTAALVHTLESGDGSGADVEPFGRAAADIARRIHLLGSHDQARRFLSAVRQWAIGVSWQVARTESGSADLNTLLAYRSLSSGGALVSSWFDYYVNNETCPAGPLPYRIADDPILAVVTRVTWLIATIDNDLVSYTKEEHAAQTHGFTLATSNIVANIVGKHDGDLADAMRRAAQIRNNLVLLFQRLRQRLLRAHSDRRDDLANYLDNYGTMIRGNLEWSLRAERYSRPHTDTDASLSFATTELCEPPEDTGPPPYPAITWWWEV